MSEVITLNNVCELIVDSEHKTAPVEKKGYPYIRTPNIGRGRLILENVRRVGQEAYVQWTRRAIPQEDDLILAREAPVGNVAIVPAGVKVCLGQRTVLLRPNKEIVYPAFLNYLLLGNEVQGKFHGVSNGATVKHLNLKDIRALVLPPLPEVNVQKELASIIANYDNLIENNNRRIVILEDMAQSLYREWFVKFRFPGHENVKFKDSPLGQIPEGWEEMIIGDVAKVKGGKRLPKGKKVLDDETPYPYLRVKDFGEDSIDRSDIKFIDEESHLATQRYIITTKDIYVSIAGTIGRVGVIPYILNNAHLTENAAKITDITQPLLQYYIHRYLHADTGRKLLISRASGSSQPKLALYKIAELPLLLPTEDILREFHEHQESILALSHSLENKNENIKKQRDMLLPRLISGQINLKD